MENHRSMEHLSEILEIKFKNVFIITIFLEYSENIFIFLARVKNI